MRQRERIAEATRRGKDAGQNAGSWIVDGNTTDATKARIAQGVDDVDPEVLDAINEPSWLSGEWAGESIQELLGDLLWEPEFNPKTSDDDKHEGKNDEIETAYENAASLAFRAEVERSAKA